ncbi:exo-beta-1,3-glucanase [Punctularia strigosozonata HHB-11173 SS5]|uniref:exo-beta-1,3-glucanase n=1 Tax=Punctularia strigosozonata (strain HHB-11173) TaxID=741275 RepID=UPI0004416F82|nr:exo-beta-1,3-glucanase [Punctularia strigosozonata HHB-11173 SS5]EIN07518.1 exo-beta-1,3-glucanase [Punctularia strigosozonata HHB-11173 SS5]
MYWSSIVPAVLGLLSLARTASAACSGSLGSGTAAASDPFWLESITHQGVAPNSGVSGYTVFRNVKDFGAKGDGSTDDTAAINDAISSGSRCGGGTCNSTTTTPALVYFPSGTYKVSSPIFAYYFTQLIGDAKNPPTLQASADFAGIAVIDADPYLDGGANWYTNQNNFFRSVRNFVIDLTQMPATSGTGIHWQVSQATSLINIVVEMSTADGNAQQGIFMENGSGGFMGDLVFNGGKYGVWLGNQQFTVRNITVNNAATGIFMQWNWGWTFQGVTLNNCGVGFDLTTGGLTEDTQTVGAEAIIDAVVNDTPIFLRSSTNSDGSLHGSLVLNNVKLSNVPTAVSVTDGTVVLAGTSGSTTIDSWGQGNVYTGTSQTGTFQQADLPVPSKAASLLDSAGRIFGRAHPQYPTYATSQIVSVRDKGAAGDGSTDDTAALQAVFDDFACNSIIFVDHGTYKITDTLTIPAGARVVGEVWPVILGSGDAFNDQSNPKQVVKVGNSGDTGTIEITDILFATQGPTAGAIVVEWNIHEDAQGTAGMWDSHIRLGGAVGTDLQVSQCPSGSDNSACMAAFLALHITTDATAYLEGTWVWLADHDLDDNAQGQLTQFSGRGILSESQGPVWLIGTGSEHHALYQYSLVNAADHYMGLIQTETPYYQPDPAPPTPFATNSDYNDPTTPDQAAWGLSVQNSKNILVFGAGLYSFYQNYAQDCLDTFNCQSQILNIDSDSTIDIFSLSTVATTWMLSIESSGVIPQSDNRDGFQSTITAWTRS